MPFTYSNLEAEISRVWNKLLRRKGIEPLHHGTGRKTDSEPYTETHIIPMDVTHEDWKQHVYKVLYQTPDGLKGEVTMTVREGDGYGRRNAILKDIKRLRGA